jgi:hypothetical protein
LLTSLAILSETELESRYHVRLERYIKDMLIEMHTMREMIDTLVVPAGYEYSGRLAAAASQAKSAGIRSIPQIAAANEIGDAITEKRVLDGLMLARDRRLYRAITDCGAGGLSSAVGEMAAECGAEVELDLVPLKYPGLVPEEIWISEAQERMVLAVPQAKVKELLDLSRGEDVEATVLGTFQPAGRIIVYGLAGDDDVIAFVKSDVTNPQTVKIQSNRCIEYRPFATNHVIWIDHWDEQRFAVGYRVAKANQQLPFRSRRQSFDIEAARRFGRVRCPFGKMKF